DLYCSVGRGTERADGLARVVLLPAGDDLRVGGNAGDVRREVRDVRAGLLELRRVVRAVAAEHLRLLALLDQLLSERLRVARLLGREEDDVRIARDLRHVRRIVGRRVRGREADCAHTLRLQRRVDGARETQ